MSIFFFLNIFLFRLMENVELPASTKAKMQAFKQQDNKEPSEERINNRIVIPLLFKSCKVDWTALDITLLISNAFLEEDDLLKKQ